MTPEQLLVVARRRLRRLGVLQCTWSWFWVATLIAVAVLVIARVVPWEWVETAAVVVPLLLSAAVLAVTSMRPLPDLDVARAVDAGLGSRDALSADLEFGVDSGHSHTFAERISRRAREVASAADPTLGLPRPRVPRVRVSAGMLGLVAVGALLWVPNPQDEARARARAAAEATERARDELREAAETLPEGSTAAESLLQAAERLDAADPADAMSALAATQAEQSRAAGADLHAARAATGGLERSLGSKPLQGAGPSSAAEQLRESAAALEGLGAGERADLAERLSGLASTQVAGAPDVAEELRSAAAAVAAGDPGAAAAMEAAASAQERQAAEVGERSEAAAAAAAAGAARDRLAAQLTPGVVAGAPGAAASDAAGSGAATTPSSGQGSGKGEGSGSGEGQGEGSGSGEGQGQGQGSGKGSGGGSGSIAGGDRTGSGSAVGGSGRVGSGGTDDAPGSTGSNGSEESPPDSDVFAPPPTGNRSDDGPLAGTGGRLESRVGTGDTTTDRSAARLPLSEALRRYRDGVTRAAEAPGLPSAQRELITDYFARLSQGDR